MIRISLECEIIWFYRTRKQMRERNKRNTKKKMEYKKYDYIEGIKDLEQVNNQNCFKILSSFSKCFFCYSFLRPHFYLYIKID